MDQTFEQFVGKGVDTSVFTPTQRSSTGQLRCCSGSAIIPPMEPRYGVFDRLGAKVSPNKIMFCAWCAKHAFKPSEIWEIPDDHPQLDTTKKCVLPQTDVYLDTLGNRRCVLQQFQLPDGSVQSLQLNVNLTDQADQEWTPVAVGAAPDDQAAAKAGVLRANVPTHSYWEFVLQGYKGNVLTNDQGANATFGKARGCTHKLYCGRSYHEGQIEFIPGSDGRCGPNDGPQCQSCCRLQEKQPWFKIQSARFKNGESVSITNSQGSSNFVTPFAGGQLRVNSKATGASGKRFFSVTPPRSAVQAKQEGIPPPSHSTAHLVADHNGTSNILELEVSIHQEKKPPPPVYRSWGDDSDDICRSFKGGATRGGTSATIYRGAKTRGSHIVDDSITGGSNFGAAGYSQHVRTTTTKSTFPEITRVKFTIQLVNTETDSERTHFANIIDTQIYDWKQKEIARLLRQKDQIDSQIEFLRLRNTSNIPNSFDWQAQYLVP